MDRETGKARGFGFVQFEDAESLQTVLDRKPHRFGKHKLDCRRFGDPAEPKPKKEKAAAPPPEPVEAEPFELFVGGLPEGCTSEMLLNAFADCQPKSARIKLDDKSKKSCGFGFVCFHKEKHQNAVLQADERKVSGKVVTIKPAVAPKRRNKDIVCSATSMALPAAAPKLFVGGLGPDTTPAVLEELLQPFIKGDPVTVELKVDKKNACRGFGFISFGGKKPDKRLSAVLDHQMKVVPSEKLKISGKIITVMLLTLLRHLIRCFAPISFSFVNLITCLFPTLLHSLKKPCPRVRRTATGDLSIRCWVMSRLTVSSSRQDLHRCRHASIICIMLILQCS